MTTITRHSAPDRTDTRPVAAGAGPKPLLEDPHPRAALVVLWAFVIIPFLALLAAVPLAWGWGLSWTDIAILTACYLITGLGITVGYHRYLTHGSFKATRWLRITLATAGALAIEGQPTAWVATHRRHHAFSDRDGDPHSPWRYGPTVTGLTRGLIYAHIGWMLLSRDCTNRARFAPDLLADRDIRRIDRLFPALVATTLLAPAMAGGLLTWSWQGALTAFFWGGLIRVALLHHVTWAINSVCHVAGQRPFNSRDKAANFWPLAIISFGENWHNSHHADPSGARHGVLPGQIDPAARLIWTFEKLHWAHDVHWPQPQRLAAKRATT